jgi:lysophospholipase L1-like esterase
MNTVRCCIPLARLHSQIDRKWLLWLLLPFVLVLSGRATAAESPSKRWEEDIRRFEEADKTNPPPQNGILFIGSSGIALWKTLQEDFSEFPVINRGFGGSHIADSVYYADRIVIPYKPRLIVFRAGINDLHAGKSPEQVLSDFASFVQKVRERLPDTRIVFLSINPSIKYWDCIEKERAANVLIQAYVAKGKNLDYVDIGVAMLAADGKPRPELYVSDGLHCTAEGYKLWTSLVRPHLK